jgi:hypothetical protein
METLTARRTWSEIWALNESNFIPKILYPENCHSKLMEQ